MNTGKDFQIQATNAYVILAQEEASRESGGLLLPDSAVKKTNFGHILSVGELVGDKKIKAGKTAAFHADLGFQISDEGVEYLVIRGEEILYIK